MIDTTKLRTIRVLSAAALAMAGCSGTSGGEIPCVEDASCPNDYPVCGPAGKCIAGTSTSSTSVAVVGAEGHIAADFLSGTVRVLVTARAASGVQSVKLAAGSTSFSASTTAATPPLYAFDVDTATLADGDASLTATLTAGDGSTATANGTLHVDNAKPVITTFTVAGATTTTITAGKTAAISASFTGGVSATITSNAGGSVSIATGGSVLVSPDVLTSYSLRVTSRSGVSVQSGSTGQPPDVSVAVVQAASFTGNFTVDRTVIDFSDTGNLAFTAPTFPGGFTAVVNDGSGASQGAITSGGQLNNVAVPSPMAPTTTQLTYTLVINNGATIPDTVSVPLIVKVRPKISTFAFQSSGTNAATFDPGDSVGLNYTYSGAPGGSAKINGVDAPLPGPVPFANIQASTVYTLTVTNSAGTAVTATATATVRPKIYSFAIGATQSTATSTVTISNGDTTNLFASFAGSGASGSASGTVSCATSCNGTLTSGTSIANGIALGVTGNTNETLVYTLTVSPSSGAPITASATIKVVPAAHAASLSAGSGMIHAGASTTLTPIFDFGTSPVAPGSATITGSDGSKYANLTSGTGINIAPSATTTYTLNVFNAAGAAAATAPTNTVTVAPGSWSALNTGAGAVENGKRLGATVTPLGGGKVLIAGGLDGNAPLKTARVCDASGACTSTTTDMQSARAYHTAVTIDPGALHNGGKVLLAGGFTAISPTTTTTTSAEFYDPTTNSFTDTTIPITTTTVTTGRARHIAVLLSDGKTVLIAGGTADGTANLNTAIEYDAGSASTPSTADITGNMAQARADFTGTLLGVVGSTNVKVLVVGGKPGDSTAELFDPAGGSGSGTFSTITGTGSSVGEDKRSHTAVRITGSDQAGKVLISGGIVGTTTITRSSTQVLYDPTAGTAGTFTAIASAPLGIARSNHAAIALSIDVLICGGTTNGTDTVAGCELYHPTSGLQLPTPSMIEGRKDFGLAAITISSIEQILASGGTANLPGTYAETYEPN